MTEVEKQGLREVINTMVRISNDIISKDCESDQLKLIYDTHIISNNLINIKLSKCEISNQCELLSVVLPQRIKQLVITKKNIGRKE